MGAMLLKVQLSIKRGLFTTLCGESGSGKTTLLRILAGLEQARGNISVDGQVWLDGRHSLAVQKRQIGFVFQDYALFPNMSVIDNLLFVKKDRKLALELLEMTKLIELAKRKPPTLSGGQKQRVSLCRALMNRPKLLLMDEPLSALDPHLRASLQQDILMLHKAFGTTSIMVSHDPSEIYKLSQRVILIEQGKVIEDADAKSVLLKTHGSQKFVFEGELLDVIKVDVISIAIVAIGQQIVEVVVDDTEVKTLQIGDKVLLANKAFNPIIKKI